MERAAALGTGDVDVILPVYNMEKYVGQTVRSILSQTRPAAKLIVIDDGSTDGSRAVVEQVTSQNRGPTKVELVSQPNAGLSAARNAGIKHATAEYIAFVDADDLWDATKLEKQMAIMEADTANRTALVYCAYRTIDENGKELQHALNIEPTLRGSVFPELLHANLISGSGSAALVRRSVIKELGGFDTDLKAAEDWDMWLRIAKLHPVDHVQERLVSIRRHPKSMQADTLKMVTNYALLFKKWFVNGVGYPAVMHQWGHLLAEFALRTEHPAEARKIIEKTFNKEQRSMLFKLTFGSLRSYMFLKSIRSILSK